MLWTSLTGILLHQGGLPCGSDSGTANRRRRAWRPECAVERVTERSSAAVRSWFSSAINWGFLFCAALFNEQWGPEPSQLACLSLLFSHKSCVRLSDPTGCTRQASLSLTISWSLRKLMLSISVHLHKKQLIILSFKGYLLIYSHTTQLTGSQFWPAIRLRPWQWKCQVLNTGQPGSYKH